jgi:hypothetical protein
MRRTQTKIDQTAVAAMLLIGVGWFLMTTLVVNFGLWQEGVHFYDLLAVIRDPAGRLSTMDRSHPYLTLGFGLVCSLAVLAPVLPMIYKTRAAWLTYLIPLTLMVATGAILYARTSSSYVHVDDSAPAVSAYLARIAARVAKNASDMVATRISIGTGAYLALLASCWLGLRGLRRFREAAVVAASGDSGAADLAAQRQHNASARQIEP